MNEEDEFLLNHLIKTLTRFITRCRKHKKDLGEAVFEHVTKQSTRLALILKDKKRAYPLLRTLYAETAGLLSATEWQSPSFNHSTYPQAGLQTGKVTGNITDYTRDQLIEGNKLQRAFASEFVGTWRGIPIEVLFTQSGMGALTTILTFLQRKGMFNRPVILGKNSYFQNKELVHYASTQPVIEVDEHNLPSVKQAIRTNNPSVLFFDSLCNAPPLAMPDLSAITKTLIKYQKQETYLVIDNTCLATALLPLTLLFPWRGKVKLLVFESLNKYYQYGMDRTIGGFCWGLPQDASKLFYARLHAGTIMSDTTMLMLPQPNKHLLLRRLKLLQRNALHLSNLLEPYGAIYPKLLNHPAYEVAKKYDFTGACINLSFKTESATVYKKFMKKVLSLARHHKIPLIQGSSFGLDITRIYITALYTEHAKPFVRISVGTEPPEMMDMIGRIIIEALKDV